MQKFTEYHDKRIDEETAADAAARMLPPNFGLHQLRRDRYKNDSNPYFVPKTQSGTEDEEMTAKSRTLYKKNVPVAAEPVNKLASRDQWSKERAWGPFDNESEGEMSAPDAVKGSVYTRAIHPSTKSDAITPEIEGKIKQLGAQGYGAMGIALTLADDGHKLNYKDVARILEK